MPLERVSKSFKDISMSFKANPLNDDLIALKNETAIARSIRNIIFTNPGEKFFNQSFGSRVSRLLFENVDEITSIEIQNEIENSIISYEPRVSLRGVTVIPNYDENSFDVMIIYRVIGIDISDQQLEFVLLPTR